MTVERAIEILDPTHREHYDSIDVVNEACKMGMEALALKEPMSQRIAELEAEIERLQKHTEEVTANCIRFIKANDKANNQRFLEAIASVKSEAYREFAERLKRYKAYVSGWDIYVVREHHIDNLVKELTESNERTISTGKER